VGLTIAIPPFKSAYTADVVEPVVVNAPHVTVPPTAVSVSVKLPKSSELGVEVPHPSAAVWELHV
jgi:hypothetical protein